MDEAAARDVVAVRAIEVADRDRVLWTDADRAWASRAAAEVVTEAGTREDFLVRRARLARERLVQRFPAMRRTLRAFTWPAWAAPATWLAAFFAGISVDRIGGEAHINILAAPVLGLLVWNVVVYALLLQRSAARWASPKEAKPSPLRRWLARLAGARHRVGGARTDTPVLTALATFGGEWSRLSAGLYAARAARILHLGAAAFALGVVAGFYIRGLALEYRASWQSTFLDADQVHALLRVVLAPGTWLTGLPVPATDHIARLRTSATNSGENAAEWLHLYAATVAIVVIVPRLLLSAFAWTVERRRERNIPVALADPYFRRLVRGFLQGPLSVAVVPYSFTLTPAAVGNLQALAPRAFGQSDVRIVAAVPYGGEDKLVPDLGWRADITLAVFGANATPEVETHGAFLRQIKSSPGCGQCIAILDESAFRDRWPGDDARLAQRRSTWQDLFASAAVAGVSLDLAAPDLERAAQALDAGFEGSP